MAGDSGSPGSLLGFLVVEPTITGDGFISGAMVTDDRGHPLEFKATTPVRPSLVQKTLYGATLSRYVGVELCGKGLVHRLSRAPMVVLVPDHDLLDIACDDTLPVVAIRRAGEKLKVTEADVKASGTINPPQGNFQPIVYEGRFPEPAHQSDTIRFAEDCAARFDLIEVFERIREALKLLQKEDKRYA
ncbi:MAG: hypothetical protein ACREQI_03075 [Candidatus Binataceae bacterium]